MNNEGHDRRILFAASLAACAEGLSDGKRSGASLRQLQRQAQAIIMGANEDVYLRTIAFIIDQWVKDYYFNFAGDVISAAWTSVEDVRIRLLSRDTSRALNCLADAIPSGSTEAFEGLQGLVCTYLEAIKTANAEVNRVIQQEGDEHSATI